MKLFFLSFFPTKYCDTFHQTVAKKELLQFWDYSFSTFAKFSKKLSVHQGVRNISFSKMLRTSKWMIPLQSYLTIKICNLEIMRLLPTS